MASKLKNLSPITVGGKSMPKSQLFGNIPMLHSILEEVLEDWLRAVEPYQRRVDDADGDSEVVFAVSSGFMDLQPLLLKCLFSYAFFFVAADSAYAYFYKELNLANNKSGLRLQHCKPPKETPFVKKIRRIRDRAIAHFPSEKAEAIDAYAAMSWQPMSLAYSSESRPDMEQLTFAPGNFRGRGSSGQSIQSQDLKVSGLKTTHYNHCLPYLNRYDEVCCKYLQALQTALS